MAIRLKKKDVPSTRKRSNSLIEALAYESKELICRVYNGFPDRIVTSNDLTPSFVYNALDDLCAPEVPPRQPPAPLCEPRYHIFGTYIDKRTQKCNALAYWRSGESIPRDEISELVPRVFSDEWLLPTVSGNKKIRPINKRLWDANELGNAIGVIRFQPLGEPCVSVPTNVNIGDDFRYDRIVQATIPPGFCDDEKIFPPTTPPPVIIDNRLVFTGTINQFYDFKIETNPSGNYDFPIKIDIGLDLKVTLDIDGFTFENTDDVGNEPPIYAPPAGTLSPPPPAPPFNPSNFDRVDKNNNPVPPSSPGEEVEEEEVENPDIEWVLIDVVKLPRKGKIILQKEEGNNTYFAGYFSWLIAAEGKLYRLGEEPLRKKHTAFKSPPSAAGYAVFSVNGAELKIKRYVQPQE